MSAEHVYDIRCDADGCRLVFASGETRAAEAREKARSAGWLHALVQSPGRMAWSYDFCFQHALEHRFPGPLPRFKVFTIDWIPDAYGNGLEPRAGALLLLSGSTMIAPDRPYLFNPRLGWCELDVAFAGTGAEQVGCFAIERSGYPGPVFVNDFDSRRCYVVHGYPTRRCQEVECPIPSATTTAATAAGDAGTTAEPARETT